MEDVDGPTISNCNTPLAIVTPGKVTESEVLVLGYLDDLMRLDRAEGIRDTTISVLLFFRLLLLCFGVP